MSACINGEVPRLIMDGKMEEARESALWYKATFGDFFLELQQVSADWLALTTTKTGAVYRLKGNPPQAHE